MKIYRHRRIVARTIALALATVAPLSRLQAQAPPPAAPASGDAKDFQEIADFVTANKWTEAMKAAEKFLTKYQDLSPRSRDVRYLAALAYLHQDKMQDDAVRELKKLLPDNRVAPEVKEQAMLLIAKAYTLKGSAMPAETAPQIKTRNDVFEEALKAFDAYLAAYPQSRGAESAYFLSGILTLEVKRFDDARKRFGTVYQNYPRGPLRSDALLNVGKAFLIEANDLLTSVGGKEPTPENIEKALGIYKNNALPALTGVFSGSTDLAILNEAQFYIGQIRLTQSQHVSETDEESRKKAVAEYLNPSLDAFRAVRSIEEVIAAQESKIKVLEDSQARLYPRDAANYLSYKNYYQGLIDFETDRRDKLKSSSDQDLAARVSIARIFLILKKYDECRVLIRYLQGQKELFTKDKDQEAAVSALLAQTYAGQGNFEKTLEAYQSFRTTFPGNEEGEILPLFVANLAVENGKSTQAEEIVTQAMGDYKAAHNGAGWMFANDAVRVMIRVALDKGDFQKAQDLCEKVLTGTPKPDVEMETLFIKGSVQEQMARVKEMPAALDQALSTFQILRDKFPTSAKAEDAWFRQCQILAGKDAPKAIVEITKYLDAFSGGGKSESTKNNLAANQYILGKVLAGTQQLDKAVAAFRKTIETYPDDEVAPDSYFQITKIENDRKNYPAVMKINQEFVDKFPNHKNVYFAYTNIADLLSNGSLNPKSVPTPGDRAAGAKKLMDYVDYELEKKVTPPRGEGALLKASDIWLKQLPGGAFDLLPADKKVLWQQSVDGVLAAVEKQLKSYPEGERLPEALERAVTVQSSMLKARQTDAAKGEAYFRDLISKYGSSKETKSKILVALGSFMGDADAKGAIRVRAEARGLMPEPIRKPFGPEGKETRIIPSFTSADWDKHLSDLFDEKKYDDMTKVIARVRLEYPLEGAGESSAAAHLIPDAQAVALFWEAKLLEAQNKLTEAGAKLEELITKYPKTPKKFEADYGVIAGKFAGNQLKGDLEQRSAIKRLTAIIGITTGKTFDMQAKALLLIGRIYEDLEDFDAAIGAYAKIADRFGGVSSVAAEGLWRAAVILDKQANKEKGYPVKTPAERQAAALKAKAAEEAARKLEESKTPVAAPAAPAATPETPKEKTTNKPPTTTPKQK